MQLGLLGKQNLAINPKRRKRLRRLGNDFGHICFKVSLPTKTVLNPDANMVFLWKSGCSLKFLRMYLCKNHQICQKYLTWHTTSLLSKIQFDWKVLEFWGVDLYLEWIGCHGNSNDRNPISLNRFVVLFKWIHDAWNWLNWIYFVLWIGGGRRQV